MLIESGVVASVESDSIWVASRQSTSCGNCSAQKQCGTGILSRFLQKPHYVRVLHHSSQSTSAPAIKVGDHISFGLQNDTLVKGAIWVYMMPLLLLITGIALFPLITPMSELLGPEVSSAIGAIIGLLIAGFLLYSHALKNRFNSDYHPILVDKLSPLDFESKQTT